MATILKVAGALTDLTLPKLYLKRLLDPIANVDRAYSFRHIRGAYAGPLVKVRRSSDAAVLDVYALPDGTLDAAALLAFTGAGDAFVHTFYDQGPAGKHLTQATTAAQAKVVAAGALVTANGKPAATFDGVDDAYVGTQPALWAYGSATVAAVLTAALPASQRRWWTESLAAGSDQYGLLQPDGAGGTRPSKAYPVHNGVIDSSLITPQPAIVAWDGTTKQLSATDTGAAMSQWINGASDMSAAAYSRAVRTVDRFTLGGVTRNGSLAPMAFTFSESVWLKGSANTATRQTLEASQKAFYATA